MASWTNINHYTLAFCHASQKPTYFPAHKEFYRAGMQTVWEVKCHSPPSNPIFHFHFNQPFLVNLSPATTTKTNSMSLKCTLRNYVSLSPDKRHQQLIVSMSTLHAYGLGSPLPSEVHISNSVFTVSRLDKCRLPLLPHPPTPVSSYSC